MTVFLVSLTAHSSDEIAVSLEISDGEHTQRERLIVSVAQCSDLRLMEGEIDERIYDEILYASNLHTAVRQGLSILSYGTCSERAIVRKLISRGNSREIAETAVEELRNNGYIDQDGDASREAERGAMKLWGRMRITAALREKGYSEESVRYAIGYLKSSGVDFVENCTELIRRKWGEVPADRLGHALRLHYRRDTSGV